MTIKATNTLEIRLHHDPGGSFGADLEMSVGPLRNALGCLNYNVNRCDGERLSWIICGQWRSETDMHEHFASAGMTDLVNLLVEIGANLVFTSLVPLIEVTPSDRH